MSTSVFWRAALIQAAGVAILAVTLAIALPHSFFEDWGWVAGPTAWAICSVVTARALDLPVGMTLLGAAVAGIPGLLAVLIGVHWLGTVVAIAVFSLWCARLPSGEAAWT